MKRWKGGASRVRELGFGTVAIVALCIVALALSLRAGLTSDRAVIAALGPRLGPSAAPPLTPTVLDAAIVRTAVISASTSLPASTTPETASTVPGSTSPTVSPELTTPTVSSAASSAGASSIGTSASALPAATTITTASSTTAATTASTTATAPSSTTTATTTSVSSSTTATGVGRRVDLTVAAAIVGPLVEGRAAFVSITIANAGPDTAWAPRVTIELPAGFAEVSSLDPAWSCQATATTATCGGSLLDVGASSVWALRGILRNDIVLQSSSTKSAGPAVTAAAEAPNFPAGAAPTVNRASVVRSAAAPSVMRLEVSDGSGGLDRHPDSNVVSLAFGPVAPSGLGSLDLRTIRGGLVVAANSLLTCDRAEPLCAAALASGDNADALVVPNNTMATAMAGTSASSSATLAFREGATVAQAWLVWGAVSLDGSALPRTNLGTAWLSTPSSPAEMVIPTLFQTTGANDFYARADVTNRVRGSTSGSFGFGLVGGLAGLSGTNQSAGWALVVLYSHPSEPLRTILVLDGLQLVGGGPATTVALGSPGLVATPSQSLVAAQVALIAFDGDRGQADLACVNGVRLGDAANPTTTAASCDQLFPTDDIFNATVSVDGLARQNLENGSTTFLGLDADLFTTAVPGAAVSSFTVKATADVVRIGFFALAFNG